MNQSLRIYREMQVKVKAFYESHRQQIEKGIYDERADHIRSVLPDLMNSGTVSIWCRNSDVCREATHCQDLRCKYKHDAANVVEGTATCQRFQMTTKSENWGSAKQIAPPSSVDVHDNYSIR